MSPPSHSSSSTPPGFLTGSMLLFPWVWLARLETETLLRWAQSSRLLTGLGALFQKGILPVRRRFETAHRLHTGISWLHGLACIGILGLACVADTDVIGLGVIGAGLVLGIRGLIQPIRFQVSVVDGLVGLFFLTALVATFFSSYTATSLVGMAKFSLFLLGYLNFRVLFANKPCWITALLGFLVLLGVSESCIGFWQYLHHIQPLATWQDTSVNPEDQLTRIFGTLKPSNPNLLAGFLIPSLAGGIGLALYTAVKRQWLLSGTIGLTSLMMLAALALTGSRGGYLAILVMGLTTFLYLGHLLWHEPMFQPHPKLKVLWLLVLLGSLAAGVGAAWGLPALRNRFLSIFAMREDSSNSYRLNVWISTLAMIKDNWLLGIGPGNNTFKLVYGLYMTPGYNALSAYSIFLEIWVEQGIFGILTFLLLVGVVKVRTLLALYTQQPTHRKVLMASLWTGVAGSVVYGLFDTIWYRPSVNLLFWLFVAAAAVLSRQMLEDG